VLDEDTAERGEPHSAGGDGRQGRPEQARSRRRDLPLALALGLASLALYAATMCRTVFWYDSAEYVTASVVLGIPHPPGYPLYTLIGHLFTRLPIDPALAVNLMSAVFGALGVALAYLVGRALGAAPAPAAVGAATLGCGRLYWSQSLIAEVYTPAVAATLAVLLLLLAGLERGRARPMVAAALVAGLGLGLHLGLATCGLGFAALVGGLGLELRRPGELVRLFGRAELARRARVAAACLGAACVGSCIFLYVPLRAAMGPALNFENPSSWGRFLWFVTGGNYKRWWLEDYDRLARALQIGRVFYDQLLVVGLALAAVGAWWLWRRRPLAGLALVLAALGNTAFFFRYSVHDVEVFFLPTVAVLCVLCGLGAQAAVERARQLTHGARRSWLAPALGGALGLLPLSLAIANYGAVDLSGYTAARDYGERMCAELPQGAVILNFTTPPEWKNDAVFTHYFQKVLGRRRDVRVTTRFTARGVARWLERGVPVFVFYPEPRALRLFELARSGPAYRLLTPRTPR
jgi:hypothetical protein